MKLASFMIGALAAGAALSASWSASAATAADCPNGGTVRMGVEPFEASATIIPIFEQVGRIISAKLGCDVKVYITTDYNAEIEAMRNGKLELAEFGPLGYVLAHQVAKAEAIATFADENGKPDTYTAGIVTWPGSGITDLKGVAGRSFAYADPASTSGHLFPAYALTKIGIDPDKGIKGLYAGSHTASFEAIRNHKVDAGELNSQQIGSSMAAGVYKASDYVELWRSDAIPNDPVSVWADLEPGFKARLTNVIQTLDLSGLDPEMQKHLQGHGPRKLVKIDDHVFDQIRELVGILKIDLTKM